MANYPYILKTGALKKFFDTIPSIGIPDKVTVKHLEMLNFKSTNDRPIIVILKFLKFIDETGIPGERYKQYRDRSRSRAVLGAAVRDAYQDLFKLHPDADQKDHQALHNYFNTQTGRGERAVKATTETFKALCAMSDFGSTDVSGEEEGQQDRIPSHPNPPRGHMKPPPPANSHAIELGLSEGRKARIFLPDDVTDDEIEKVKRLLTALKASHS
jgi:hypothetical protein